MLTLSRPHPSTIAGTGTAFPAAPLSNDDVIAKYAPDGRRGKRTPDEIAEVSRTLGESLGVARRSWAHEIGAPFRDDEPTTVDLMAAALEAALRDAEMTKADLGALITATSTPARATGANAPAVAERIGTRCASWDVRMGCAGGVLALAQGCMFAAATGQPVAVVAADTFSKIVPPKQPLAALAFGDGAGAVVIRPGADARGLRGAAFDSDGSLGHLASAPSPFPPTHAHVEAGLYYLQGSPEQLAAESPALYAQAIGAALDAAGLEARHVDLFVPHQTSRASVEAAARAAGIELERTAITIDRHANCGAGTVLITLHEARREGRVRPSQHLLFAALGGGLAWGAAVVRT